MEVDVYTVEGITALHAAVIHGHRDVAELLLKHGADPLLPIKIHPDAMSFAFLSGSHDPKVNKIFQCMHVALINLSRSHVTLWVDWDSGCESGCRARAGRYFVSVSLPAQAPCPDSPPLS